MFKIKRLMFTLVNPIFQDPGISSPGCSSGNLELKSEIQVPLTKNPETGNLDPRRTWNPQFKTVLTFNEATSPWGRGTVATWVYFCWVYAASLSEPLPYYSQFCGQI